MKLGKNDLMVLKAAANPLASSILPWRGVMKTCRDLAQAGLLVEAGMSVMPPHTLYIITRAGRKALEEKQ